MKHFYVIEERTMTVILAQSALQALEHYAVTHGWRLPPDTLRLVKPGHWQAFGGEIQVYDEAPSNVPQR